MDAEILLYLAGALIIVWGISHLIPTRQVVAGFGTISLDNRRILTMEWIAEGITHVFIGVLVVLVTIWAGADDAVANGVYWVAAAILIAIAALTALTGARTPVVWFKACPVVLSTTAALLLLGSVL